MPSFPSRRLREWSDRYCADTLSPPGEAFLRAFSRYLKANRESLLDVAVAAASVQVSLDTSPEDLDPLLVKAIRDTNPSLADSDGLLPITGETLLGAVSTAKGKYFEYLVADRLNQGMQVGPLVLEEGQRAVLAESMTQPGWDMQIVDESGTALEYLQLKATDSVSYIRHALERYPDIEILATTDVSGSGLTLDSGLTEQALREQVGEGIDVLDESLAEALFDHFQFLLPLAAMTLYEGYRLRIGEHSIDEFKLAFARRGQRIAVTQIIGAAVYALGGGMWAVPAAFAGGLFFDQTINQQAIAAAYAARKSKLMALRLHQQERLMRGDSWVS